MGENVRRGETVRYSDTALRPLRDAYLSIGGPQRTIREQWYQDKRAKRGTVVDFGANRLGYIYITVLWDSGETSQTAPYLLTKA